MAAYLFLILIALLSLGVVLAVRLRYNFLTTLVLVAFLFRLLLIYADFYGFFSIPGADSDAEVFINKARAWSRLDWYDLLASFNPGSAYIYSSMGAVFFKLFGYHLLIMPFLNLLAGTFGVAVAGVTAYKIWGVRASKLTSLILALYPFSAFNSAVALREEFSILAFIIGLYFLVKWLREESQLGVFICLAFFSIATMIHPGWIAAILGVGFYSLLQFFKSLPHFFRGSHVTRSYLGKVGSSVSVIAISIMLAAGGVSLGKGISIGTEGGESIDELIESRFDSEPRGGSAYPSAIAKGDPFSQPWLIPARIVYFLFSPFPWDIRSPKQALGMISSVLYLFLVWKIFKNWKIIRQHQECVALLIILALLTFIFAIGVTNIGTAIRHKTKFLALFIIIAAVSFDSIRFRLLRR
ncbi:hypothetical protein [Halomonas sp. IOP_31]|uniref:hypothetical protein n=1 Tax=Halomonas sp. IOP_31 TaxID=2876584 RepID=UPI001E46AA0B|nr:hypothetical protein [Halomonas sp. IOP_31]MCD6007028.1 hypothetical protein [Halomonas sp. IOP_31]